MACKIIECGFDGLDHRAWRDGGTGTCIESAAILDDFPVLGGRGGQRLADKLVDPRAFGSIDIVAQTRGFAVGGHAYAGDRAVHIDADQQVNIAAIAVGCNGFQRHGGELRATTRDPDGRGLLCAQQVVRLHGFMAGEQVIVVQRMRQDLVQARQFFGLLAARRWWAGCG